MGGRKHLNRTIDRSRLENLGIRIREANGTLQRLPKQRMILDNQEPGHLSAIPAFFPIMRGVLVAPRHSMSAVITLDLFQYNQTNGLAEARTHASRRPVARELWRQRLAGTAPFAPYDLVTPCIIAAIDDHTECADSQWR